MSVLLSTSPTINPNHWTFATTGNDATLNNYNSLLTMPPPPPFLPHASSRCSPPCYETPPEY